MQKLNKNILFIRNIKKLNFLNIFILLSVSAFILNSCSENKERYTSLSGKESCLTCHQEMTGFSPYHDPKNIGCASCHLGNTKSTDKDVSHQGMILIPGNLSNASQTCATANCHTLELDRIHKSLMTSNSGIISIDRYLFDEVYSSDTLFHVKDLKNSAADVHIKNLCNTCHLGNEKTHYAIVDEKSRGGGCLACHLNYAAGSKPNIKDNIHPQINLNVDNTKCFGCHSRSGRISTNYEGWYETLESKEDVKNLKKYRVLMDGRVFGSAESDVHHKVGMQCVDCHISQEIMGDGKHYKHQDEALKVACGDCHKDGKHSKTVNSHLNSISIKDYVLGRYKHPSSSFVITKKDSIPLVNTYKDEWGNAFLVSKISKKEHQMSPSCKLDKVHGKVSCSMCHTSWAPSCIGCHTDYDPNALTSKKTKGKWVEHIAEFGYAPPAIGVKTTGNQKEYIPAIPGMIMTLDKTNFKGIKKGDDKKFVRWYAPNAAHTTTKNVRDCASCHNNPQTLGFGKGTLIYAGKKAGWNFTPYYANTLQDNLPQDAWTGFMQDINTNKTYSSHENFYPLDLKDQKKMLQVGTCIQCHAQDEQFLKRMTDGSYQKMLKNRKLDCYK